MKVLLAHKFHKYTGGADVFYLEVGRVLEKNGHDVAYFSTVDEETINSDYKKYFIKAPDFKSKSIIKKLKAFSKVPYNFEAKKNFAKLIKDFKPDIIHAFGVITQISPSIFDVAKKMNVPLVVSMNDYKHICPNYKLFHHNKICEDCKMNRFYKAVVNKCSHDSFSFSLASSIESYLHSWLNIYRKNIDLFLFASDFMAYKTEEFWGADTFRWGKLMNPFNIPIREPNNKKENYGLYFGRLIEEKGVHLIIEALKFNKDLPFKIIGNGPQLEELQALVELYNLTNVQFLGSMWGDELDDVLYNAKFVIVPSIWHENFPYVILQSFAAGVPVIGSSVGGIPELLDEGRGVLFDPQKIESLSDAISFLYNDEINSEEMGKKGRSYVLENFNDEKFYQSILVNYNSIIK
jgi:glycosyltransferase involved in cell wall biosynthesis